MCATKSGKLNKGKGPHTTYTLPGQKKNKRTERNAHCV